MKKKPFLPYCADAKDQDFWEQMHQLDELCEDQELHMQGFSLSLDAKEGKIEVPFVRFRKTFSSQIS